MKPAEIERRVSPKPNDAAADALLEEEDEEEDEEDEDREEILEDTIKAALKLIDEAADALTDLANNCNDIHPGRRRWLRDLTNDMEMFLTKVQEYDL